MKILEFWNNNTAAKIRRSANICGNKKQLTELLASLIHLNVTVSHCYLTHTIEIPFTLEFISSNKCCKNFMNHSRGKK